MSIQLGNSNAVITAHHFNPSIVNQIWLVDNGIVDRDEFKSGCLFSDMLSNVQTTAFSLFVSPDQLQFTPLGPRSQHARIVADKLGRLVELLPHTPFSALGLNFTWQFRPESEDLPSLSRRLFFDAERPLYSAFDEPNARFGGYFSKDALGARLKLDVKPMTTKRGDGDQVEFMQFAFNFHIEIESQDNAVSQVRQMLGRWEQAFAMTTETLQCLEGGIDDDTSH